MTRLPGISLAKFLKGQTRLSQRWDRKDFCTKFAQSCSLSRELLAQLAPAFEHVSQSVFHRDVKPQNITIDNSCGGPRFGLVDFGLAIDSASWRGANSVTPGLSRSDCIARLQKCTAVGNGCFWPPSSWFAFAHGAEALINHKEMRVEFGECLDFHALGVVAMKVVVETMCLHRLCMAGYFRCCPQLKTLRSLGHGTRHFFEHCGF